MKSLATLLDTLPQQGTLNWIGVRPQRGAPMQELEDANVNVGDGIVGDRFHGRPESRRQVTLIQAEHLPAIASMSGCADLSPALLRRNLVVAGINLLALKGYRFQIGEVVLEMTGLCHPCSKMETLLGPGGYNAMRGHGGITAKVIQGGRLRRGDVVRRLGAMSA